MAADRSFASFSNRRTSARSMWACVPCGVDAARFGVGDAVEPSLATSTSVRSAPSRRRRPEDRQALRRRSWSAAMAACKPCGAYCPGFRPAGAPGRRDPPRAGSPTTARAPGPAGLALRQKVERSVPVHADAQRPGEQGVRAADYAPVTDEGARSSAGRRKRGDAAMRTTMRTPITAVAAIRPNAKPPCACALVRVSPSVAPSGRVNT